MRTVSRDPQETTVTDGERLVWAATYAIVLDRDGDAISATRSAAHAVEELRAAAQSARHSGPSTLPVEENFLDEIVSVP